MNTLRILFSWSYAHLPPLTIRFDRRIDPRTRYAFIRPLHTRPVSHLAVRGLPERIVVKSKLSQNKDDRDRINAAEELQKRGEREVSAAMLAAKN